MDTGACIQSTDLRFPIPTFGHRALLSLACLSPCTDTHSHLLQFEPSAKATGRGAVGLNLDRELGYLKRYIAVVKHECHRKDKVTATFES